MKKPSQRASGYRIGFLQLDPYEKTGGFILFNHVHFKSAEKYHRIHFTNSYCD